MNTIIRFLIICLVALGCKERDTQKNITDEQVVFNQALADELQEMMEIDQLAASNPHPPKDYSHLTQERWEGFKDSVYLKNQKRAQEILNTYGFVGFDLAGVNGSRNFWLIVQHSDHNPEFQKEVLVEMKKEVAKQNAISTNYGLLVDRVNLNTGKAQIYGTQVTYNMNTGQAYPRRLEDSIHVNQRRKSIGLEPIEKYLNEMTEMHFEMNKDYYSDKGITNPTFYKIK
jgi:hypothetical protein